MEPCDQFYIPATLLPGIEHRLFKFFDRNNYYAAPFWKFKSHVTIMHGYSHCEPRPPNRSRPTLWGVAEFSRISYNTVVCKHGFRKSVKFTTGAFTKYIYNPGRRGGKPATNRLSYGAA
jgi:hypothetical protein